MEIRQRLYLLQDSGYQAFTQKLIPNLAPENIIGVRIPLLRALAVELAGSEQAETFLTVLPHDVHEENLLHAFFIEKENDFRRLLILTELFLPYIDNWAVCDSFSPPLFKRYPDEMIVQIRRWMNNPHPYTQRYGMKILLSNYLDTQFKEEMLLWVSSLTSDDYYVKMMQAWYFATALIKQYDTALPYLVSGSMDRWTHNKAIQKAMESRLISPERKQALRELKRK